MGLSGDMKTMPVTDLLQWVETTQKTGIAEFHRGNEWKKIFFQSGQILFVSSSKEDEKIGRYLIRNGLLHEEDLYRCLDENERTGKKLTEILEKSGLISHQQLYEQVVHLIKEILFDLFHWKDGTFTLTDRSLPKLVKGPLALKTGQILFSVLTLMDEKRRDGDVPVKAAGEREEKQRGKKARGRIVLKVDDKKFSLPGSYEKSNLSAFRKVKDKERDKKK